MPQATDYYRVLGVTEAADAAAIKHAYRDLAHRHHPDRNGGAAADAFVAVQEAYSVLSDPDARRAYDLSRSAAFVALDAGRYDSAFVDFGYGRTGRGEAPGHGAPQRSADVETQVQLTFSQALRGGRTEVRLASGEPIRLTIPKGIRSGVKVRVRGYGRPMGGERGDLYVTFRVDRDDRFRREGDNLHVVERVSALEAMLGTTRSITNAYGQTIKVPIAPGTQPGERLRLRGQGIATPKRTGDLFVEIHVTVPRSLSAEQREQLAAFARALGILDA